MTHLVLGAIETIQDRRRIFDDLRARSGASGQPQWPEMPGEVRRFRPGPKAAVRSTPRRGDASREVPRPHPTSEEITAGSGTRPQRSSGNSGGRLAEDVIRGRLKYRGGLCCG
jgi:hypothetical protein